VKTTIASKLRLLLWEESGQVLPVSLLMFTGLLGVAGLTIDVGHVFYCERTLQEVANAAALAGAGSMRTASTGDAVIANATAFSAVVGSVNARGALPNVTMLPGYPALKCLAALQSQGMACLGTVPYNAIQVQEQVVVPTYFAGLFGIHNFTITRTATAASRGASASSYNVAVIVDTTLSMAYPDADCGSTQISCALSGVQVLLKSLSPCAASLSICQTANGVASSSVDRVALFTFDNVSTATASTDSTCTTPIPSPNLQNGYWSTFSGGSTINYVMPTSPLGATVTPWSGVPSAMGYSFPTAGASSYTPAQSDYATSPMTLGTATYQLTSFLSDYRTSDTAAALNPASTLVKTAGGVSNCGGMTVPNYAGVYGTYYAGAIYSAQAALIAQRANNPGSNNVIIILGDGDSTAPHTHNGATVMASPATSNGSYPSWVGECGQAITAAQYATSQGTQVYSVAYGASPSGCSSDRNAGSHPNISPCDTMAGMASSPNYFYSDYNLTGSNSNCISGQSITALSQIFVAISGDLTTARLIPNGTT
jgi:hypothetical protein